MGNYIPFFRCSKILGEAGKQEILNTENVPEILDLKSSSEQIFSKNSRWVPLTEKTTEKRLLTSSNRATIEEQHKLAAQKIFFPNLASRQMKTKLYFSS